MEASRTPGALTRDCDSEPAVQGWLSSPVFSIGARCSNARSLAETPAVSLLMVYRDIAVSSGVRGAD